MLRETNILFLFSLVLLIMSCSTTKDLPTKSLFPFEYESEAYEIISLNDPSGDGMNFLIKVKNDTTVFKSIDRDQDGLIDLIQYGSVSVDKANLIYAYGIQQATVYDKFKSRNSERIFSYSSGNSDYSIQTFGNYQNMLFNEFILYDSLNSEEVFLDLDADGQLDQIKKSNRKLEDAQHFYEQAIQEGIEKNQIELIHEKYVVKVKPKNQPS